MKCIPIVPRIEFETTSGEKLQVEPEKPLGVSQLELYLALAGEPPFCEGLRGVQAARFQHRALEELRRAFGKDGEGIVSDDVAAGLARAAESTTLSVRLPGPGGFVDVGPQVQWCFLSLLEAIGKARNALEPGASAIELLRKASRRRRGEKTNG